MSPASPSLFLILSSCSKSVPSVPPSPTDHRWALRASNSLVLITARETPGHQALSHLKTEMVHKARDEHWVTCPPYTGQATAFAEWWQDIHTVPGPSHAHARSKWSLTTWLLESCTRRTNSQRSEVYYVGKD